MARTFLRIALMVFVAVVPAQAQRSPLLADVIVVDRDNNPVTNLTASDFIVREDGAVREVGAVVPAGPPSPIVLLVDNSQAANTAIADLRQALTKFVSSLTTSDAPAQIGLRTFGERPTKLADPTASTAVLRGIEGLFHRPGAGAHMLEAIAETTADLVKARAERPALVAFVVESGPEFSQEDRRRVTQALQRAGATLWVVVLQTPGGVPQTDENRERAAVIGDVTIESGGLDVRVLSPQGIPSAFDRVQRLLASRVRIAYGRPDSLIPPKTLEITTKREGLRVLASRWASTR
jgi:hypothetical protein